MTTSEDIEHLQSPLESLLNTLQRNFPFNEELIPLMPISKFLGLGSEYSRVIYESAIYFVARRLVTLASHSASTAPTGDAQNVIHEALKTVFDLKMVSDPENLVLIVYECYKQSEKSPNQSLINRQVSAWLEESKCCYICGISLEPKAEAVSDNTIEVEHRLPRSLGGGNTEMVFRPACHKCNQFKKDRIGAADLHHESLAYKFSIGSKNETDYHRFAAQFFNNGNCGLCGQSAEVVGQLRMVLREPIDSWHLFNILLICDECNEEGA